MRSDFTLSAIFAFAAAMSASGILEHNPDQVNTTAYNTVMEKGLSRIFQCNLVYHFYNKDSANKSYRVTGMTVQWLIFSKFVANKETMFIIHGWRNSNESSINYKIRENVLKHNDINVFVVDWRGLAGKNYLTAQRSVVKVGRCVADFINSLKFWFRLKLQDVKLVGHSLGAHICGNAGSFLKGNIDTIIGLDPSGPFFTFKNTQNRLDPTDAQFVQVIHTSDRTLGFQGILGHADYYPNGGGKQRGCKKLSVKCSHARSYKYYAESLDSNILFIGRRCPSYNDFNSGRCRYEPMSYMGRYNASRSTGTYYLKTNKASPYARRYIF